MEMAAKQPAETIRVNDACEAAGISRATFYRVATSPAEVIVGELRKIHEKRRGDYARLMTVPGVDNLPLYVTRVSLMMADVREHADIYRESFSQSPSILAGELLRYIRAGIEDFIQLRGNDIKFPASMAGFDEDVRVQMLTSHFAHSELGLVRSWVEEGDDISVESVVQVFFELAPSWYLDAIGYR